MGQQWGDVRMQVNRVVFDGNPLIDITDSNFDVNRLPLGSIAYNAAGERVVGQAIVHNVYTDTTANWNAKTQYIPVNGDVIVYTDKDHTTDEHGNVVNVPAVKIGDGVTLLFNLAFVGGDSQHHDLEPATTSTLGGVIVGDDLLVTQEGRLSVDKATSVEGDNTRPITAAAVYTEIGNINALLATI